MMVKLTNPLHILLLLVALLTACATQKKTVSKSSEQELSASLSSQEVSEELGSHTGHREQQTTENFMTSTVLSVEEGIPKQEASLTIAIDNLRNLPNGAKYRETDGRTSVEAERQGKRIIIRGQCDSIARRCTYYQNTALKQLNSIDSLNSVVTTHRHREAELEAEVLNLNNTISELEKERKPPNLWYVWISLGAILGSALTIKFSKSSLVKRLLNL